MKLLPVFLLVLVSAACAGCTAPDTAPPAATAVPNLTGTWNGSLAGYIEGIGYIAANNTISLNITTQQGRIFDGAISVVETNGSVSVRHIAGVIGRDGKHVTVVQSDTGYDFGTIVSGNELEFVYVSDEKPAKVVIDSFVRSA
ncbi:hypothetical protein [Methanoregula sp. UBA64]|jgi:hypothetical protein|uniref:hypothetical protein n=1 Tax=Methanoregula sp. UBA64 TaxID=1915554 RepID=UPI0025D26558|nr:hypothetical protein [Methanoregula sp. UBA64]